MTQTERLQWLTEVLARERGITALPQNREELERLLRGLMNQRSPVPIDPAWLRVQDEYLSARREEKGVVDATALPGTAAHPRLSLWQGDITRLGADAIVNAANAALLGCFLPCHGCIDNAIHSAAGIQLRAACAALMAEQGHPEPNGRAKITKGYNLPAKYVLHTVGPIVSGSVTEKDRQELAECYRSCLALAVERRLESMAFCCISTGEFHFPHEEAARIAVSTATDFLQTPSSIQRVIFNVFTDTDAAIYRALLGPDQCP